MEFDPPISSRETEELIIIISSPENWNAEAVRQAEAELLERGFSLARQESIIQKVLEADEIAKAEKMEARSKESYSYFDMVVMGLFIFKTIFSDWNLRKKGYILLDKQRLYSIVGGLLFWSIVIAGVGIGTGDETRNWQNQVNIEDTYEWEREYYSDEEFIKSRKEDIEKVINLVSDAKRQSNVIVILERDTISHDQVSLLRNLNPLDIRVIAFNTVSKSKHQVIIKLAE